MYRWPFVSCLRLIACVSGTVALLACYPAFNWREVRIKDSPLLALLPCKADASNRNVNLAGHNADMKLLSCEAGSALFVVGEVSVPPSATANAMAHWQRTALGNIGAPPPGQALNESSLRISGLQAPQVLLGAQGKRPGGLGVQFSGLWFTRGAQVFHAAIYAERMSPEMSEPFFGGLALQ
jgi:hypothetical protein